MTTGPDPASRLTVALKTTAERAMTQTDTDHELERLRRRLRPVGRHRRLGIVATAAAVAALAAGGIGLAVTWGGTGHRAPTGPGSPGAVTGHTLPPGTVPRGFPIGTFKHAGTFGLTQLTLSRRGTATLVDPRDDLPTVMAMTFVTPDRVSFDITALSASTVRCDGIRGTYRYQITGGRLTFTPITDSCDQRRIPLSELPWGPLAKS